MSNPTPHHSEPRVLVLIVTYGDRWSLLREVLLSISTEPSVKQAIIVNNAVTYDLPGHLNELDLQNLHFDFIHFSQNKGSAGGIKAGLNKALTLEVDFVYILDDDNVLEPHAIEILLAAYDHLADHSGPLAMFSYRGNSSPFLRKIAHGLDPSYVYNKKNNFAGFSLQHLLSTKYRKWVLEKRLSPTLLPIVKIPVAPWSGLLLPMATLRQLGEPLEAYFLYSDDIEYTYRISQNQGAIWMVTASQIKDIETSWGFTPAKNALIHIPILENGGFRMYYTVRNLVHFSKHNLVTNPFLFYLNGILFSTYLFLAAVLLGKMKAFSIYWRAIINGLRGNLGANFNPDQHS